MNNQNLLIYESQILYEILIELSDHLNFKVVNISKKELNNLRHYFSRPRVCSCKLLSFCLSRKLRTTRKLKREVW